ncbi:MAG: bacillithiol system redox-active protein YtxJ [Bacteroidetes bacterium]|nr:bacillithiol system redox-active protein YtxJ [Bacteroidota bacterium]
MNWIPLNNEAQLQEIIEQSKNTPQVIFKHSTRCSISSMALNRMEQADQPANIDFYYLDLIQYRPISQQIAELFSVFHESPQVLLIKDGNCTYSETHMGIRMDELIEQVN